MQRIPLSVVAAALFSALLAVPSYAAKVQHLPLATGPEQPMSLADRRAALNAVFKDYWQDYLKTNPEFASTIGDKRYNDQITDYSVSAFNNWLAREQDYLMRLAAIDPAGFTDQEKLSQNLLEQQFVDDEEASEFKEWEMPVTQLGGVQTTYLDLAPQLNFATVKDYDDWIARLHAIPHAFDQVTNNMALGMQDQRTPPRLLMEEVLKQVQGIAAEKPEDSPLALPLKQFPASVSAAEQQRIKTEMLAVIAKQVLPAYQRFGMFLERSYIPACRTAVGINALSDGAGYYQLLVRRYTTTKLTPAQIHQMGLDEVKKDEAQMLVIAQRLGFKDLATFRASLQTNPKLHVETADQMLNLFRSYLTPMEAKLPELFGRLPKAKFEVLPVPTYMAATAPPAFYEQGSPDGSRPGRLFINTYKPAAQNTAPLEAIAYHEGVPGHHLQISIAQELTDIPEFRKYAQYTAFIEGWGLYAEQLGKDVGFYKDPYSDYGRLESDLWRAVRLVVDTGLHSEGWTREQAVAYCKAHSAMSDVMINSEVNRYIADPGQALAYKVGQLKILELRARAQKELGSQFSMKAFHDEVLDSGALPLDVLETRLNAWIAAQKQGKKE